MTLESMHFDGVSEALATVQCQRVRSSTIGRDEPLSAHVEGEKRGKPVTSDQNESSGALCIFPIDVCSTANPWIRCWRGNEAREGILVSTPLLG